MSKINQKWSSALRQGWIGFAALFITLVTPAASQASEWFDLDVFTDAFISRGSCLHAWMAQPGEALFDVNGWPIPTYPVEGQFRTDLNGDEHNQYKASFQSVLFRPGSNSIYFRYGNSTGEQSCVNIAEVVTLSSASFGSRRIFDIVQIGQEFEGVTSVDFSLMELDPALATNIAHLEQIISDERANLIADAGRLAKRDAEIAKKLDMLKSLDNELKALAAQGFDAITAAKLRAIFARYPDLPTDGQKALAQLIEDLHKDEAKLREEISRLVDDFAAQADAAAAVITGPVRKTGWDPGYFRNYLSTIYDAEIPEVATPELGSQSTFDGTNDPYDRYAVNIIEDLTDTLEGDKVIDKPEFVAVVRGWRRNQEAIERIIRERATVNQAETQAFLRAQNKVLTVVRRYMGAGDWFNDAPLSPELKRLVDGPIRQHFAQLATSIKDGMNQWTTRGPGEEMLEEVTIGMGSVLENGYEEQPDEVQGVVTRVLGWVGTAATIGVGFTPVGDVLDACEAITGRELCNPNGEQLQTWGRVAAGLGVVIGSGKFWQVIGSAVPSAKTMATQMAGLISISKKKPVRYGPINPGPLSSSVAGTFRSASYTALTLSEPVTLYRVYGGKAPQFGRYWTRVKPSGALQTQLDSAILPEWGNTFAHVAEIRVPAGTTIYEGVAAPQKLATNELPVGELLGGGDQVFIPTVDPLWASK